MKTKTNINKRSLSTTYVINSFESRGIKLSVFEAEEYLDLLYFLARLIVKQEFLSPTGEIVDQAEYLWGSRKSICFADGY